MASKLSTCDFSTLYTLPHHLIKDKLINLINRTFIRKNTQYLDIMRQNGCLVINPIIVDRSC